ncbi:helix-turn-helix domain-containing protein [Actinoplanes sp. NBC_00393]|uniref:AfsR/SARP family transcriptional regulator n=1 Tax=Actinoplanes sp. NBC_00393 TaxID=2975953 RepID=UPI002E23A70B
MTDGALRFEILGPVRAYRGAEEVDLGPVKQRALLALLLLNAGRPVPLHEIVTTLWNGDPPENGVDVVQRYIGGLRRALDPARTSLLALTDRGYVLRVSDSTVDADQFRASLARARDRGEGTEEVRRALSHWQQEPLAGLTGPFFAAARARLNSERANAARLLAAPASAAEPAPAKPAPAAEPAPAKPASTRPPLEPTRVEPRRPALDPTRVEPDAASPAYPDAVDPWAGHDLFPPDPTAMR